MTQNSLLLTQEEALKLLPFGRHGLESIRNKGEIGFKKVGRRYYYAYADIVKWANNLQHHTASTKEETIPSIGHTSPMPTYKQTKELSLDALLENYQSKKPSNFVSKKLRSYNHPQKIEHQVNCLA